jgi:uncharacterized DUF497 family protein
MWKLHPLNADAAYTCTPRVALQGEFPQSSFEQAQRVFDDPRAVPFEDLEHSTHGETRYVMIGMSSRGLLFVSFTYRKDVVRLISARRAEKWMVKVYEDEN